MIAECLTTRYNAARLPPAPLSLAAPLKRAWKYAPKGSALGFVRTSDGAVFTNVGGRGWAARVDLRSGQQVWADRTNESAALITGWNENLLVFGGVGGLRGLNPATGEVKWTRDCMAGLDDSFVVGDVLVGKLAEHFHAIDLQTFDYLWKVADLASNPLASDGSALIRADDDVTCYELQTGAVRWKRPRADFGGKAWQMGFIWRDWFFVRIGEPLLLTALEVKTGKTVWRTDFPVQWCEPYGERAYGIEAKGAYKILDLATGKVIFERSVAEPPEVTGPKAGLMVERAPNSWPWRDSRLAVSETHTFIQRPSGQIVVLGRDTGNVEQVVEIDGMPIARTGPIIYENRLLLTDFNAAVYCFEGAA